MLHNFETEICISGGSYTYKCTKIRLSWILHTSIRCCCLSPPEANYSTVTGSVPTKLLFHIVIKALFPQHSFMQHRRYIRNTWDFLNFLKRICVLSGIYTVNHEMVFTLYLLFLQYPRDKNMFPVLTFIISLKIFMMVHYIT